jgi:type IV pilus assembly protein PilK
MSTEQAAMSAVEISLWRELVQQRCGLAFSDSRLRVLAQGLQARMKLRLLTSYLEYYNYVVFHPDGRQEWAELLELLVNKETSFFRHPPSYEVLPQLRAQAEGVPIASLRLWSAGCSTGQEPYSMAMSVLDAPECGHCSVQVIGSDVSHAALERARRGRYRPFELRQLPERLRKRYLRRLDEAGQEQYEVVPEVRSLVEFQRFNLIDPDTFPAEAVDVIFCQNVLIYFPRERWPSILRHLGSRLRPGGYLLLAPGEAAGLEIPELELVARSGASLLQRRQPMGVNSCQET